MSKLERLMTLMATLLHTSQPLSAEEIHRRVDGYPPVDASFRRAFERDKDDLREMGIPISVLPVPDVDPPLDGYRIRHEDYYLQDPGLEPDELAAVAFASQLVQFEGATTEDAVWKLGGNQVASRPTAELAAVASDPAAGDLLMAVRSRATASFSYNDSSRTIEPWRVSHQRGRWYVHGFDRSRDADRQFRLDRIHGAIEYGPGNEFTPPPTTDTSRQPWEFDADEELTAHVRVDADQAAVAAMQLDPSAVIEEHADGSMDFSVRVSNLPAFRSFVLAFLDHAEVLGPEAVRNDLIAWLESMARA